MSFSNSRILTIEKALLSYIVDNGYLSKSDIAARFNIISGFILFKAYLSELVIVKSTPCFLPG